ncbi:hypothetical protein ACFFX0_21725 [Citricoccus parietis]|uniref:Uncharacterized protein n=1 Tax=Citricoccus parietis TaxID=592307 RepID=A0ABV5G415_9MICC
MVLRGDHLQPLALPPQLGVDVRRDLGIELGQVSSQFGGDGLGHLAGHGHDDLLVRLLKTTDISSCGLEYDGDHTPSRVCRDADHPTSRRTS